MFRERLDQVRFVVLVFYHVIATVFIAGYQWTSAKLAALTHFIRHQAVPSQPSATPRP